MPTTLTEITNRLPPQARQKMSRQSARAETLGWIEVCPQLFGKRLVAHALTLPNGQLRNRLNVIGNFLSTRTDLCYEDFILYANEVRGWWPDEPLRAAIVKAFAGYPQVRKLLRKYLEPSYPNLGDAAW